MTTNTDGAMPELPENDIDGEEIGKIVSDCTVTFEDGFSRLDNDMFASVIRSAMEDYARAAIEQAAGAVPESNPDDGYPPVPKPSAVAFRAMCYAHAWVPTDLSHMDKMRWMAHHMETALAASPSPLGREAGSSDHSVPCAGGGVTQPLPPVPKYDPRMRFLEKEKGTLDMRIEGLSMRQIKDIFEQEYGELMWSEGSAYPSENVKLQFIRADLAPRPSSPSAQTKGPT